MTIEPQHHCLLRPEPQIQRNITVAGINRMLIHIGVHAIFGSHHLNLFVLSYIPAGTLSATQNHITNHSGLGGACRLQHHNLDCLVDIARGEWHAGIDSTRPFANTPMLAVAPPCRSIINNRCTEALASHQVRLAHGQMHILCKTSACLIKTQTDAAGQKVTDLTDER